MRQIEPWSRHWSEAHGEEMIQSIQQGLLAEGVTVSITKLCTWFGMPRRTVYDTPTKAMIEAEPSFGYRTVAWLLGFNKNTVQRIFQLKGWQVRKRAVGMWPRIEAVPSVATAPNERSLSDIALQCPDGQRVDGSGWGLGR
jgi:putative transposase